MNASFFKRLLLQTMGQPLKHIILSGLLCTASLVFGQSRWGIRVNQNTDLFTVTYRESLSSPKESQVHFGRFSAGLNYTNNKVVHEFELFVPEINASTNHVQFPWPQELPHKSDFKNQVSCYSLRYAVMRNMHSLTQRFHLAFGFAVNPYYLKGESIPKMENTYYLSRSILGASLNIMPAINFNASERVVFTLDCPFKVVDFYRATTNIKNPAIPVHQQKTHTSETAFFMKSYTVRIGIAYRLGRVRKS